jgi:CheB methylesterase
MLSIRGLVDENHYRSLEILGQPFKARSKPLQARGTSKAVVSTGAPGCGNRCRGSPGKHTLVTSGLRVALIVSGASPPSRPSADLLLATRATACGPLATAVVLSGGGHDGVTGATAIHRLGGTVIASSEVTSDHFVMPQATIERAHFVDHIAELDDIAGVLRTVVAAPESSNARNI